MKISLKWLSEYIDVAEYFAEPKKLVDLLTYAGLEVENLENQSQQFSHVVIGHIEKLEKHPDADKLTYCMVNCGHDAEGNKVIRPIVCGAKNHKEGDKVIAALPGAILPGDFKIKISKIRGVESQGMLCSDKELGLSSESEGIRIVDADTETGQSFAEAFGLDDIIFELSVTANRADCLSHIGLARELSCLTGKKWKYPEAKITTTGEATEKNASFNLVNADSCPRYAGRCVYNVKVGESPAWLKNKLESIGVNSINNVVDVTNFVMMEYGQPMHAFDLAEISDQKIIIQNATKDEAFTTLDGTELKLTENDLTIRDSKGPVALAGIIGGKNSGVTDKTQHILLESAYFTQQAVRKTMRFHGLETDSSYRFSRGTNPELIINALDRASQLLEEVAGGEVADTAMDVYPNAIEKKPISVSASYVSQRLGYEVSTEELKDVIEKIGGEDILNNNSILEFTPPNFRMDIAIKEDIVEEVGRLKGYENIPEILPSLTYEPTNDSKDYTNQLHLENLLSSYGLLQAENFYFVNANTQKELLTDSLNQKNSGQLWDKQSVNLQNPISEELNQMRKSLAVGLLKNLVNNYKYGSEYGRVFETGPVFGGVDSESDGLSFSEQHNMSWLFWGDKASAWDKNTTPIVLEMKSLLEKLFKDLGVSSWQLRDLAEVPGFIHPGQCSAIFLEGKIIGYMGSIHPSHLKSNKIRSKAAFLEISLTSLMRGYPRKTKLKSISKFQSIKRDFAFVIPETLTASQVLNEIRKASGKNLEDVEVFDIYSGKPLQDNETSLTFRVSYRDADGTLDEAKLTELQKSICEKVAKKLNIQLR